MWLKSLVATISGGPYYVRLRRDRLTIRDATSGGYFDEEPLIALSGTKPISIQAVGSNARAASSVVVNPFLHPRVLIADYALAEKVLAYAFKIVSGNKLFRTSPIVVVHVTEDLQGGLASIERRALSEALEAAGARKVFLWQGRDLTDEELRAGVYR